MTRSELTNLFIRKTELFNSEQLLASLKESYSVATESGFSENLERNIFELEQKIARERAAIARDRETALQTLKLIEDDAGRVGAMLHYLEGMPWDVAAALLRYISGNALRAAAYRGMNAAKIVK